MKRRLFSMMAGLLFALPSFSQEPIRVACVGDSITYGDKIFFRSFRSYPAVLQKISDGRLVTGNFGVNGTTALQLQGRAWTGTDACRDSLLFQPDVVVIMLGINDLAFPDRYDRYPEALRGIVNRFQALSSTPRLFLCTLTPLAPANAQMEANQTLRTFFNPAIRQVAAETGAQVIELHSVLPATLEFFPDGIHPSPEGAARIAQTVFQAVSQPVASLPPIHVAPTAGTVDLSIRNEARAAQGRADRWMAAQSDSKPLPDPAGQWTPPFPQSPDDLPDLLPLLEGGTPPEGENPYFAMAALALALDRIGQDTVFLASDRSVRWREALLHQLVQSQKMNAHGQGFWTVPGATDPSAEAFRSTTYALQAIDIAFDD